MSRWSQCAAAPIMVSICAMTCGCGAPVGLQVATLFDRSSQAEPADANAAESDNPLRRELAKHTAAKPPVKTSKSVDTAWSGLDAETRELIERELAEANPAEREQLANDLKGLEPPMIRQILRIRKMVRQVESTTEPGMPVISPGHSHFAGDIAADRSRSSVHLAGAEVPPAPGIERSQAGTADPYSHVPGRTPANDPGLGAVDPWGRVPRSQSTRIVEELNSPGQSNTDDGVYRIGRSRNPVEITADGFSDPLPANVITQRPTASGSPRPQPAAVGSQPQVKPYYPNGDFSPQDGRLAGDQYPPSPRVPNYSQSGGDPFAQRPPVQTASRNPDQAIPGVMPRGNNVPPGPNGVQNPDELAGVIARYETGLQSMRYADQVTPEDRNRYIQQHVFLRLLYLIDGQEERALAAIPDIPPSDREFWQQVFWATANYFDTNAMPDSDYRATQTVAQLRTAVRRLQENARLELRNVAFCHKISSFGNYERFERDEFRPGQPVLLYAEVGNFKSDVTPEGQYKTVLKSRIEISRVGPSGEVVEEMAFPATEDFCHNYRQDYFHSYEFSIPQQISLGPHVLVLTVEDQLSQKVATYRLNFMVK